MNAPIPIAMFILIAGPLATASWIPLDELKARNTRSDEIVCLFFGRDNCPFSGPAEANVEALMADGRFPFPAARLDVNEAEGRTTMLAHHVAWVPRLVFLRGSEEVWRAPCPPEPENLVTLTTLVNDGKLSWSTQRRKLEQGALTATDMFEMADSFQELGNVADRDGILRSLVNDAARPMDDRRRAHWKLIEQRPPRELLSGWRLHELIFGPDPIARINVAWALFRTDVPTRSLVRVAEPGIRQLLADEDMAQHVRLSAAKLPHDLATGRDPSLAAWALAYTVQGQAVEPKDSNFLRQVATLALLTHDEDAVASAVARYKAAYDWDNQPGDFQQVLTAAIAEALADGTANAERVRDRPKQPAKVKEPVPAN